jgi:dTDP-4-amino-4,6-dideoxygalactose transaminase
MYLARNAVWHGARMLGLAGQEVLAPAYHHGVEIAALRDAGAQVRFVRVDGQARLDVQDVAAQISPRTRALYVIHYAGFAQPMDELRSLARAHRLLVIEDCARSLFSREGDRHLGSGSDAAFFCFYKTLPVSHGGALVLSGAALSPPPRTRPPPMPSTLSHALGSLLVSGELHLGRPGAVLRRLVRLASNGGRAWARRLDVAVGVQEFDPAAVKLGMSELMRWVVRFTDAEQVVQQRRANWLSLHEQIGHPGRAVWQQLPQGTCPLFYGLRFEDKNRALAKLHSHGVQAVDFWRFGHPSLDPERFPEVAELRRSVVELPCHQDLGPEAIARVATAARRALGS